MQWLRADRTTELLVGAASLRVRRPGVEDEIIKVDTADLSQLISHLAPLSVRALSVTLSPSAYALQTVPAAIGLTTDEDYLAIGLSEAEETGIRTSDFRWKATVDRPNTAALLVGAKSAIVEALIDLAARTGARVARIDAGVPAVASPPSADDSDAMSVLLDDDGSFAWVLSRHGEPIEAGVVSAAHGSSPQDRLAEVNRIAVGKGISSTALSVVQAATFAPACRRVRIVPEHRRIATSIAIAVICTLLMLAATSAAVLSRSYSRSASDAAAMALDGARAADEARRLALEEAQAKAVSARTAASMLAIRDARWADVFDLIEKLATAGARVQSFSFDAESLTGEVQVVSRKHARQDAAARLTVGGASADLVRQEWIDESIVETFALRLAPHSAPVGAGKIRE